MKTIRMIGGGLASIKAFMEHYFANSLRIENKICGPFPLKNGTFVQEPKCCICGGDVKHEWLDGDYTLLLCESGKCFIKYQKKQDKIYENTNGQ